ncbi:MAG TPA: hypothetical protein VM098_05935 [Phycisphaerae bacterium]|nr:hypothetical protein [Phycisphaerae bacterium]
MLGPILVLVGAGMMLSGSVMLAGWVSGKSRWFNASVYDRQGCSKTDRMFIDLYFIAMVLAPLLGGAIVIVVGLLKFT